MLFATNNENLVARWRKAASDAEVIQIENADTLDMAIRERPDELVIFDLDLPGLSGHEAAVKFCREHSDTPMICMAGKPDETEGLQLVSVGARGYCNRYIAPELLEKAIGVVNVGEVWLGRKLITKLMANLAQLSQQTKREHEDAKLDLLTDREKEIARLVGGGANNKQIAQKLDISERTVKAHMGSIFTKTDTKDRLQLGLLVNICRH